MIFLVVIIFGKTAELTIEKSWLLLTLSHCLCGLKPSLVQSTRPSTCSLSGTSLSSSLFSSGLFPSVISSTTSVIVSGISLVLGASWVVVECNVVLVVVVEEAVVDGAGGSGSLVVVGFLVGLTPGALTVLGGLAHSGYTVFKHLM